MMGVHHAITGAGAWVALTATVPGALGVMPLPPLAVALGAITCAGAALLPDADHPSATIAQSIPVLGKVGANAISGMVGGHRHGSHSLLAIPVIALLAWLLQFGVLTVPWWPTPVPVATGCAATALIAFAVKVLGVTKGWLPAWITGAVLGCSIALLLPEGTEWVASAIVIGFVTHLVGDFLTIGGLPLLWPLNPRPPVALAPLRMFWMPNGYFAFPILGKTGSAREWLLGVVTTLYTGYLFVALAHSQLLALTV